MNQLHINEVFRAISIEEGLLPVKVTPFYERKIKEEVGALGNHLGPLHRVSFPTRERISLRAPNEVKDFVDDRSNACGPANKTSAVRKYADRVLFLTTSRCFGNCQYCFRTDVLRENAAIDGRSELDADLRYLLEYLRSQPEVTEVILSGGDPLILPGSRLEAIIEGIRSVPSVKSIRIHTRAIVYEPKAFTAEKIDLFAKHNLRITFHIVHPYEICDEVSEKIAELRQRKLRLYNQFPLLRNTNDHQLVLYRLLEMLDDRGVRNLSIFIPDPINFSAAFRVRLSRVWHISDRLNFISPSWINSTRFVFDSSRGKVRREHYSETNSGTDVAIFVRDGKSVSFPDFPEHLDVPGKIEFMLWKEKWP
ncbi:radical SAM protein [Bradyrhizobium sp. ISRA443]|uniref:radical SAM protein n=1 Tax=unclassified Bradyrhizobium TaxID=2631580 RepID=UPI002479E3FE|nr:MULTISPECIES: radical SAM protein [unclassified Bradyrhizobium]WGR93321.1 radical SAM protein [Bradyrhizobium sp. ISRA435]WGR97852.1 radical SAM protein [Bradyrhizobium sp. ISRA436]WGS04742.1 radical SAM protein [Bradyrhizobium sp. ISRA437]WGS11623.1 radical SAM protein [Bradyrhizobium sp. ISRA443]